MIVTGFLYTVYALIYSLTAVFRLAPEVSLPTAITDSISTASAYMSAIDLFFPVHEMVFIFLYVFVVYELAVFAYKLLNWVIRKIPGIS